MHWSLTGATQYRAQLGLPNKGCAIKGLIFCNDCDLEPLDLLNGLALGCYQPSPEVLIVYYDMIEETRVQIQLKTIRKIERLIHCIDKMADWQMK